MKRIMAVFLAFCAMLVTTGCMAAPNATENIDETSITFVQDEALTDGSEIAKIETTLGMIKLVLFPKEAPNTVENFRRLVKDGFYTDRSIFLEGDVKAMLSGSADETMTSGKVLTDDEKKIKPEITQNLWHFNGAVSAWGEPKNRFSKEMLSDSRFFIVGDIPAQTELITQMQESEYPQEIIDKYKEKGGLPQYTGSFTVFGQVYEGMDIVKKITDMVDGTEVHVVPDIKIKSITLDTYKNDKEDKNDTGESK